jgi:hypothetical protein
MEKRQLFGILGSLALVIGVFSPFISVPIMGALNYFQNGKGDGVIVLVLAVISLVTALSKRYRWLWLGGIGTLAMLAFSFVNFRLRMSQARSEMVQDLEGNPFAGLAELAMESIQMQWGWAILLAGAILLLIGAGLKEARPAISVASSA